jgi:hypothetical protein
MANRNTDTVYIIRGNNFLFSIAYQSKEDAERALAKTQERSDNSQDYYLVKFKEVPSDENT